MTNNVLWLGMTRPTNAGSLSVEELCSPVGVDAVSSDQHRRDEARASAFEEKNKDSNTIVHTVSIQDGHEHLHLKCNVCSRDFVQRVKAKFGKRIDFQNHGFTQIVLDYYWMPDGEWYDARFGSNRFYENLIKLQDLLSHQIPSAGVIVPFTLSTLNQYRRCEGQLHSSFDVVPHNLEQASSCVSLFAASKLITQEQHSTWLGKASDQEEAYLGVTEADIRTRSPETSVSALMNLYRNGFSNAEDIKFLLLRRKTH